MCRKANDKKELQENISAELRQGVLCVLWIRCLLRYGEELFGRRSYVLGHHINGTANLALLCYTVVSKTFIEVICHMGTLFFHHSN